MADADEDLIHPTNVDADSADVSDETQDFRFLVALSRKDDSLTIPKRGEKDFEQHGTRSQENTLQASQQAMADALSYTRLHKPTSLTGYVDAEDCSCVIDEPKGSLISSIGTSDSKGRLHLLPEECLYLVERGSLNLQWRSQELFGIPLSLQAAYAHLIGSKGLSMERYIVYSGLKRNGYVLQRALTWYPENHDKITTVQAPPRLPTTPPTLFSRLFGFLSVDPSLGPSGASLLKPGLHQTYPAIYKQLALIPFHDPTISPASRSAPLEHHTSIRPSYNVWKPTARFRKTAPPPPDYRICVMDAREDAFPTLEQLDDLMRFMPHEASPPQLEGSGNKIYQRLRHGYRSVILAVVDQGIVSYVRLADAGFGCERLWDMKQYHAGSKSGGGRGRGRGRGRGGRGRGG